MSAEERVRVDPSLHKALDLVLLVVDYVDADNLEEITGATVDDLAVAIVQLREAMGPPEEELDDSDLLLPDPDDVDGGLDYAANMEL